MNYPHNNYLREYLSTCSDRVKNEGLNYLIPKWKSFIDNYLKDEDNIFEWLNDVDTRDIIRRILNKLTPDERKTIEIDLKPLDDLFIKDTDPIEKCVWGEKNEIKNQYNSKDNWYYYRINKHLKNEID